MVPEAFHLRSGLNCEVSPDRLSEVERPAEIPLQSRRRNLERVGTFERVDLVKPSRKRPRGLGKLLHVNAAFAVDGYPDQPWALSRYFQVVEFETLNMQVFLA